MNYFFISLEVTQLEAQFPENMCRIYIEARRSLFSCACNLSKAGHGSTFPVEVEAGRSEQCFSASLTT